MKRKANEAESLDESETKVARLSKIVLNVGGTKFATSFDTLRCHADSYFNLFTQNFKQESEYFIDRSPKHFEQILDYLRCKEFTAHVNAGIEDLAEIKRELEYYQLSELIAAVNVRAEKIVDNKLKECRSLKEFLAFVDVLKQYKFDTKEIHELLKARKKELDKTITVDVGGQLFFIRKDYIEKLSQSSQEFNDSVFSINKIPKDNYMQFQKDPKHFNCIVQCIHRILLRQSRAVLGAPGAQIESAFGGDFLRTFIDNHSVSDLEQMLLDLIYYKLGCFKFIINEAINFKFAPSAIIIRQTQGLTSNIGGIYRKKLNVYDVNILQSLSYVKESMIIEWDHNTSRWKICSNEKGEFARSHVCNHQTELWQGRIQWSLWDGSKFTLASPIIQQIFGNIKTTQYIETDHITLTSSMVEKADKVDSGCTVS